MKENEIRPELMRDKYLELSAKDAEIYFSLNNRKKISCIACNSSQNYESFSKNGFQYSVCKLCGTLYQSPRPNLEEFESFYRDSISSRYWAEVFFPAVAEKRRELIFKPRAINIANFCNNKNIAIDRIIEVGSGYGIFLEEWRKIYPKSKLIAIEPSKQLAQTCRSKNITVVEELAENVTGYNDYADLLVCFEVLEHVYDPVAFVKALTALVRPGGYVFISTLCVDGFDIQMLWDKSNSIFPPHHINFFSIQGFNYLMGRAGLSGVEISTPGVLDVEIVKKYIDCHPTTEINDKFVHKILNNQKTAINFQKFLSENQLSSHAWIFARKPEQQSS